MKFRKSLTFEYVMQLKFLGSQVPGERRNFKYAMPFDGIENPQEFQMPCFAAGW